MKLNFLTDAVQICPFFSFLKEKGSEQQQRCGFETIRIGSRFTQKELDNASKQGKWNLAV